MIFIRKPADGMDIDILSSACMSRNVYKQFNG